MNIEDLRRRAIEKINATYDEKILRAMNNLLDGSVNSDLLNGKVVQRNSKSVDSLSLDLKSDPLDEWLR